MSFRVRKARPGDADEAVLVLRRSITELCQADHGDDPERLAGWLANKQPEIFLGWLAEAENTVLVAEDEQGRLLGVGSCHSTGHISLNYVSPDARFIGVSTAMVAALEAALIDKGCAQSQLVSTRTAHAFYLAQGYCDAVAADSGSTELRMEKELRR